MSLLDVNRSLFASWTQELGGMGRALSATPDDLSNQIEPQSIKPKLTRRFSRILSERSLRGLFIKETRRLFAKFLQDWAKVTASWIIEKRSASSEPVVSSRLRAEAHVLKARLAQTEKYAQKTKKISKKHPLKTYSENTYKTRISPTESSEFKPLSGLQMANELGSYFLSLFCGVDFFHCIIPAYCWISGSSERAIGALNMHHAGVTSAFHAWSDKDSKMMGAISRLDDEYVQGICLMHMLRGSQDANMKNTLFRFTNDPRSSNLVVSEIVEVNGENIMSKGKESSELYPDKSVASMRIWWLGLPGAGRPLTHNMLLLVLSWTQIKLLEFHNKIGLFSPELISHQVARLIKMQDMAREALSNPDQNLTAREMFKCLVHNHPTLDILTNRYPEDMPAAYDLIGSVAFNDI